MWWQGWGWRLGGVIERLDLLVLVCVCVWGEGGGGGRSVASGGRGDDSMELVGVLLDLSARLEWW